MKKHRRAEGSRLFVILVLRDAPMSQYLITGHATWRGEQLLVDPDDGTAPYPIVDPYVSLLLIGEVRETFEEAELPPAIARLLAESDVFVSALVPSVPPVARRAPTMLSHMTLTERPNEWP